MPPPWGAPSLPLHLSLDPYQVITAQTSPWESTAIDPFGEEAGSEQEEEKRDVRPLFSRCSLPPLTLVHGHCRPRRKGSTWGKRFHARGRPLSTILISDFVDSIKRKSSLRNKSPAAAACWGGSWQHVGVWASRSSAGRAGDHEKELGEIFYTGGISEQQPVGGEQQQPGVPCGSGDGARGVRNSALSTLLLPVAIGDAVVKAGAAARNRNDGSSMVVEGKRERRAARNSSTRGVEGSYSARGVGKWAWSSSQPVFLEIFFMRMCVWTYQPTNHHL
jgi:hypothetical protein